MPDSSDELNATKENKEETTTRGLNRRRLLQIGGVGLSIGALATVNAAASSDELPNTIVIDGSESDGSAEYEFLTTGSAAVHPELGANDNEDDVNGGHVTGAAGDEAHAYLFDGELSYLDVSGTAEVRLLYGDDGRVATDRLEIVAASDGEVEYEIISEEPVTKVLDNDDYSADPGEDSITEEDDGMWVVEGSTENGSGDTYDFHGEILSFEPVTGDFTLFFNGEERTVTELTGQEAPGEDEPEDDSEEDREREHYYSFEATGDEYVDYYLEVEEDGDMIASTLGDAVVEDEYHWINEDGTKAAGRAHPGETHTYEFDSLVADVTIEGEANAIVNGVDSNLDQYPRDVASGDYWKGYFPWQLEGEEREHYYSFEATGDEYVDYYFEVEEGGELIPSTVDDSIIEYEFFWIGDDGTKAAGRVHPGDKHAYEFDSMVADVTIEGEADAIVNDVESNLHIYPQDSASGDHWKTGFPWQDDDHEAPGDSNGESDVDVGIRHDNYDGPLGGGDGMPDRLVYEASDADIVVSDGNVDAALNSASNGDVVYVEGSASGFTADVPGVTIAGNRGLGDDGEITGEVTVTADEVTLNGLTVNPNGGTALTIRAQWPVFYNCAFINASNNCIQIRRENTASTFTQCRFHNWSGYGFHHNYNYHDEEHKNVIEYSEFSDLGRHGLSAGNAWYRISDCHMHGTLSLTPDHFIEVRAPNNYGVNGSAPVECGAPCGNAIIEHNLHEMSGGGQKSRLIVVRGEPTDGVWVRNNEAPGNDAPDGGCWQNNTFSGWGNQIVMQNASGSNDFSNVHIENNER